MAKSSAGEPTIKAKPYLQQVADTSISRLETPIRVRFYPVDLESAGVVLMKVSLGLIVQILYLIDFISIEDVLIANFL